MQRIVQLDLADDNTGQIEKFADLIELVGFEVGVEIKFEHSCHLSKLSLDCKKDIDCL